MKRLSPRESEVLLELLQGKRNAIIGASLGMETGTVKAHVRAILLKTGFATRYQLIAKYQPEASAYVSR